MDWTYLLGFFVFLGLFGYLAYALMHPEKF
jgi:K+-transporting ATPase KdpF subunit